MPVLCHREVKSEKKQDGKTTNGDVTARRRYQRPDAHLSSESFSRDDGGSRHRHFYSGGATGTRDAAGLRDPITGGGALGAGNRHGAPNRGQLRQRHLCRVLADSIRHPRRFRFASHRPGRLSDGQTGEGRRALGASFMAGGLGCLVGTFTLALAIPAAKPRIYLMGAPELFVVVLWGLSMVAVLAGRRPIKGLIAAVFGLLIATVGQQGQSGIMRFVFDQPYLLDGIPLSIIALALLAFPRRCIWR